MEGPGRLGRLLAGGAGSSGEAAPGPGAKGGMEAGFADKGKDVGGGAEAGACGLSSEGDEGGRFLLAGAAVVAGTPGAGSEVGGGEGGSGRGSGSPDFVVAGVGQVGRGTGRAGVPRVKAGDAKVLVGSWLGRGRAAAVQPRQSGQGQKGYGGTEGGGTDVRQALQGQYGRYG